MDRQKILVSLESLTRIAGELGDDQASREAGALRGRVHREEFFVACVGQFKRGKSTLLDALLGDAVLPVGITPVTAVPTVVRYGDRRSARVQESDGIWREIPVDTLAEFVSEEKNPGNRKGILGAEVLEPSALLENGLCLVDTPGIGSVFDANTRATLAFVPHIDVVLAVIGTDPPISGDELGLIEDALQYTEHIVVVLNKADRASQGERQEASGFATRMIEGKLGRPIGKVFHVSATDQLKGLAVWPDWAELVAALRQLAVQSRSTVALAAGERGVRRIGSGLITQIQRMQSSLTTPLEENEGRIKRLREIIVDAERGLDDLGGTLAAQEAKLERLFEERSREFLRDVSAPAHRELASRLRTHTGTFGPSVRRRALAEAQHVASGIAGNWLARMEQEATKQYEDAMHRFAVLASDRWRSLRESDVEELRALPDAEEIVATFVRTTRFRFNEQITVAQPSSPLRYAADVVLNAVGLRRVILREAHRFLDWLLELNVGRVESDLRERVRNGRRALEQELHSALRSALSHGERALQRVRMIRDSGTMAVTSELARLRDLLSDAEALLAT